MSEELKRKIEEINLKEIIEHINKGFSFPRDSRTPKMALIIEELTIREANLSAELKEKTDLLEIFCNDCAIEKEAAVNILSRRLLKTSKANGKNIIEEAYTEGYDFGSSRNLKAITSPTNRE